MFYIKSHAEVPLSVSARTAHMLLMCVHKTFASLCSPQACCSVGQSSHSAIPTQKGLVVVANHSRHESRNFFCHSVHVTVRSARNAGHQGMSETVTFHIDQYWVQSITGHAPSAAKSDHRGLDCCTLLQQIPRPNKKASRCVFCVLQDFE